MTEDKYKNLSSLILKAGAEYRRALSSLLRPYQVSILQLEGLRIINETKFIIGVEFVKTNLPQSGVDVSRMIDELKRRGFVTRTRSSSDRRSVHIKITPAGKTILSEIEKKSFENKLLNHLREDEIEELKIVLIKISKKGG